MKREQRRYYSKFNKVFDSNTNNRGPKWPYVATAVSNTTAKRIANGLNILSRSETKKRESKKQEAA